MAVEQEPDSEVKTDTKHDKIDRRGTTCFITVEIKKGLTRG